MQSNQDLREAMAGQFLNKDSVTNYLNSEEGRAVAQSFTDSRVTKAIDTWKTNNLETEITKALTDRGYVETEDQKAMRMLREEVEKMRRESTSAKLETQALSALSTAGLPSQVLSLVMADSIEDVNVRIDTLKSLVQAEVGKGVQTTLKGTGATPPPTKTPTSITKADLEKMSITEQTEFYLNHPEQYKKLMGL